MSTPPRRPQSNLGGPHASRTEKVRNAKGQSANVSGTNLGDAPRSGRMKFFLWLIVAILVLFVISDVIETRNQNNEKKNFLFEPTNSVEEPRTL